MSPANKDFLDANRFHYDLWIRAQYVKHLDLHTRQELLRIIREEFAPAYLADLWCGDCVVSMLEFAYVQYDKHLTAAQGK